MKRLNMVTCWYVLAAVFIPLAIASSSQAAQFLMSGHLDLRSPGVNPSRSFDATGVVTTANGGNSLTVPANRFAKDGGTFRVFPGYPVVAQLVSTYTSTEATETFQAGGGPGSFKFCPPEPGAGGPSAAFCAALPEGVPQTFMTANGATSTVGTKNSVPGTAQNGVGAKLVYSAGSNQFGGTFRINRQAAGSVAFCNNTGPGAICSVQLRSGSTPWTAGLPCDASGCDQGGGDLTVMIAQGVVLISPMFGPQGSITDPGMTGGLGPVIPDRFGVGFPATTGSIRMDDNVGTVMEAPPTQTRHFTVAGYDNRNASGVGNIKLVSGSYAWGGSTGAVYPRNQNIYMSMSPLAAVSGPGILVAVGILAGGYALRRRIIANR